MKPLVVVSLVTILCTLAFNVQAASLLRTYSYPPGAGGALLAVAPSDPNVIYAAVDPYAAATSSFPEDINRLYRSDDKGVSWHRLSVPAGAEPQSFINSSAAVAPDDPLRVYQVFRGTDERGFFHFVARSTDGGVTWTEILRSEQRNMPTRLAISPSQPDIIYVFVHEKGYLSADQGMSWSEFSTDALYYHSFTVDPSNANTLYAIDPFTIVIDGLDLPGQLMVSTDGGKTWSADDHFQELVGMLSVVPDDTHLYAATVRDILWKSDVREAIALIPESLRDPFTYNPKSKELFNGRLSSPLEENFTVAVLDFPAIWWDPAKSGQGVTIVPRGDGVWGYWTHYDERGQPTWLLFQGVISQGTLTTDLLRFKGPPLTSEWDITMVSSEVVGELMLTVRDGQHIDFEYNVQGTAATLNLVPF